MMVEAGSACDKCRSKLNVVENIQINGFDSVRLRHCNCYDYFHAELRTRDPLGKEIEGILKEVGLDEGKASHATRKIGMVVRSPSPGFGEHVLALGNEDIDPIWKSITRNWTLQEFAQMGDVIQPDYKIDLVLLMLDVFKGYKKKKIMNDDVNRLFRWPLKLLEASGRIHLGEECWRLK